MVVQVHVFCLSKCGRYSVVAGGHVGGFPEGCGGARRHLKRIPFLGQLGVFNRLPGLLCSGIDLPNPTRHGYASACYCLRSIPLRVGKDQTGNKEDYGACSEESADRTHRCPFRYGRLTREDCRDVSQSPQEWEEMWTKSTAQSPRTGRLSAICSTIPSTCRDTLICRSWCDCYHIFSVAFV